MSQAFVKENEEQWLHDVAPTLTGLTYYLSRENNGVRIYERRSYMHENTGKLVHAMSNGGNYTIDDEGKWKLL